MQLLQNQTPVFVCIAEKGGVGKTITASNLAASIARETPTRALRSVLVIDLDPQGNQERALGASADPTETLGIADLLLAFRDGLAAEIPDYPLATTSVPGVTLASGGEPLAGITDELGVAGREKVRAWIGGVIAALAPHYDAIVIDTPATVTHLTMGALLVSNLALCVVKPEDSFSSDALDLVDRHIKELRDAAPTMVLVAQKVIPARRMWSAIKGEFTPENFPSLEAGAQALETLTGVRTPWLAQIPSNITIRDSATFGEPIVIGRRSGSEAGRKLREMAEKALALTRAGVVR